MLSTPTTTPATPPPSGGGGSDAPTSASESSLPPRPDATSERREHPGIHGLVCSCLHRTAGWIRSHPRLRAIARRCRVALRATPLPPLLRRGWAWLHRGRMRARDVLWIVHALDAVDVPYGIGGGWGVDALLGRQTRRHHDLDLVLMDFERDEPRARDALAPLGFHRIHHSRASSVWMPRRSLLDDDRGRCIDLVNIDDERLHAGLGAARSSAGERATDRSTIFGFGTIRGHQVACLSAEVQTLFHSDFELRAHHRQDAARLLRLDQRDLGSP